MLNNISSSKDLKTKTPDKEFQKENIFGNSSYFIKYKKRPKERFVK